MDNFDRLHNLKRSDSVDYYSFYDVHGNLIDGNYISVNIGSDGQFDVLTVDDGVVTHYDRNLYTYTRESLYVLGVGYLIPGDIVKLRHTDDVYFEVGYGWHKNISNQEIYSWYLKPLEYDNRNPYSPDGEILTLYREYLDTIELVEYTKDRRTFYIGGEPNG